MIRDDLHPHDDLRRSGAPFSSAFRATRPMGRAAWLAMVLAVAVPILAAPVVATPAWADGLSTDDIYPTMRGRSSPVETWPSLDHHYRNDMVEPGWRMYQNRPYGYEHGSHGPDRPDIGPYGRGPYSPGPYGPADARLREADRIRSSLDRADRAYRCDPWRNGCAPAEPWWTR